MPVLTEGRHPAEFLVSEANGRRSRDVVTVASGQNLTEGAVVGRITSSGLVVALNPGASDGSQNAFGVLLYAANATAGAVQVAAIVRDAEVNRNLLNWASLTGPQITAAITGFLSRNIIVRS